MAKNATLRVVEDTVWLRVRTPTEGKLNLEIAESDQEIKIQLDDNERVLSAEIMRMPGSGAIDPNVSKRIELPSGGTVKTHLYVYRALVFADPPETVDDGREG